MRAILLAGGKGTRLQPFTATFPKPLVPLDDVPIIEVVVAQLRHHGVRELTVVTGHLAELIRAFLGDGSRFGVHIDYLLLRHGARHDWYHSPTTKAAQPVPRHREIAESLAKHILKMLK